MKNSVTFVAAAWALLALASPASAQSYDYDRPLPPNPPPSWLAEGRSAADWDRYRYDYSGTRGRMGLGASPYHPEGPGNFSSPGR